MHHLEKTFLDPGCVLFQDGIPLWAVYEKKQLSLAAMVVFPEGKGYL